MKATLVMAVLVLALVLFVGCGASNAPTDTGGAVTPPADTTVPDMPILADGEGGIAFYIDGGGNVVASSDAGTRAVSNRWDWSTASVMVYDASETLVASRTLTRGVNQYASFAVLDAGAVLHVHVALWAGEVAVAGGVSAPVTIIAGRYVGVTVILAALTTPSITDTDPDDGDSVAPDAIFGCVVSDPGAYQPTVELFVDDSGPGVAESQGTVDSWNPEWALADLPLGACSFYFVVTSTSGATPISGTYTVTVTDTGGLDVGILGLPATGG